MNTTNFLPCLFLALATSLIVSSCGNNNGILDPISFENEASGCANFIVYTQKDNYSLTITGQTDTLDLGTDLKTFSLPSEDLIVSINEFDRTIGNFYCDDVVGDEGEILNQHIATSGNVEISISQEDPQIGMIYQINVVLKDVEFEIDESTMLYEELEFNEVTVGWFPG